MRYLSARQALADTAEFIRYANKQYFYMQPTPKWVVFGGSYSGTVEQYITLVQYTGALSAWMRQQYPDLVTGAISSSADMDPVDGFPDYVQDISEDLKVLFVIF